MSGRKAAALKNSLVGFTGQIVSLCLQIISRSVFIRYIGEEMLGLNNTFTSFLYTFSLAELGVQNAIAFNLYKPLRDGNEKEITEIVNVYKIIYRVVGIFFVTASVLSLPFLKFITKGVAITNEIYVFFLIQALASACTYFFAYKRTVLYADQKDYICKFVDLITNVVFRVLQIAVIVYYHSYLWYIILQLLQVYANNAIIHYMCGKKYPYLHTVKFNKTYAKKIFQDAKEIFAGRLAVYVYSATDNLIVSKIIGTIHVAFLGNYTTITANMKMLLNGIFYSLTPVVGNYLAEDINEDQQEKKLNVYTHLRFLIALALLVPTLLLMDDFIKMWMGDRFVLQPAIKVLLVADLYLILIQGACSDYVNGKGLFRQDKYITIIGVIMNLVLSLLLVKSRGMSGILLGTVCSQIFNWLGHGFVVYRYGFQNEGRKYINYILKNLYYMLCFTLIVCICSLGYAKLPIDVLGVKFVLGGAACEAAAIVMYILLCSWCSEWRTLFEMFKMVFKRFKRRK